MDELPEIKVAGCFYKIEFGNDWLDCVENLAMMNPSQLKIYLRSDIDPQRQGLTLIHEITHAIMDAYLAQTPIEDKIVDGLSVGWYQVLVDNPALLDWIKERAK